MATDGHRLALSVRTLGEVGRRGHRHRAAQGDRRDHARARRGRRGPARHHRESVRAPDAELRHDRPADRGAVPQLRGGHPQGASRASWSSAAARWRRPSAGCRSWPRSGTSRSSWCWPRRSSGSPPSSQDLGEAEETLDVDYAGEELAIGFNSQVPARRHRAHRKRANRARVQGRIEPRSGAKPGRRRVLLCYNAYANLVMVFARKMGVLEGADRMCSVTGIS